MRFVPPMLALFVLSALALQDKKLPGYDDTPFLPGNKWRVHDRNRPHPPVVSAEAGKAPSDAIVLFDGTDLSKWQHANGKEPKWKVENGFFEVVGGSGDILTRESFGDCQLHIEWCAPETAKSNSQGRGNSGVFLMNRYEVQILDSFENISYADGQAAALYGQYPPLVNACRKPGEWQSYDVIFTAPRFKDGKLESPAYITVLHNGVVVHNHTALLGPTVHRSLPEYKVHDAKAPIRLQDHGNPVRFRNIWVRPLKGYDEK